MMPVDQTAPVEAIAKRLRSLGDALPPDDGVADVNRVHLSVTEEIQRRITAGSYRHPAAAMELELMLAVRYLAAVADDSAGRQPPSCWRPLFQLRHHPRVHPLQFALAGMNAHVAHDLPLAVVDTCTSLGVEPDQIAGDYQRVGDVLAAAEDFAREELPGSVLLNVADPLTHLAASWNLETARDTAWASAQVLWRLRGMRELREEFARRLDQSAGLISRCLLTPVC